MRGKRIIILAAATMATMATMMLSGCGGKEKSVLNPDNPVTITVWNYYSGAQQETFDSLVDEFNQTVGKEKGIIVKASSKGSVSDLETHVLAAAEQQVGAEEVPNIFAAYADTAYEIDKRDILEDLSSYLTEEELAEYVEDYMKEADLGGDGSLKIFPVAKATEVYMLNKTDWDKFAKATGATMDELATIEGVTSVAEKYYEWTDGLTDEPNDGKAFFGRDAVANYMLIGAKQLGVDIFEVDEEGKVTVNLPEDAARKLWDNYYIPYINGYFATGGRFRSDDIKTGTIVSFVGSSSGASFFPSEVIVSDDESYAIETAVMEAPKFEGGADVAVQQGGGMVVTKGDASEVTASVEFLKWFTDVERNIQFSAGSGYLPVKKDANDAEAIKEVSDGSKKIMDTISVSVKTVKENELYTIPAFDHAVNVRNILEYSMSDKAEADRAAVLAAMEEGVSREDAVAVYETEENFQNWYQGMLDELKAELQ